MQATTASMNAVLRGRLLVMKAAPRTNAGRPAPPEARAPLRTPNGCSTPQRACRCSRRPRSAPRRSSRARRPGGRHTARHAPRRSSTDRPRTRRATPTSARQPRRRLFVQRVEQLTTQAKTPPALLVVGRPAAQARISGLVQIRSQPGEVIHGANIHTSSTRKATRRGDNVQVQATAAPALQLHPGGRTRRRQQRRSRQPRRLDVTSRPDRPRPERHRVHEQRARRGERPQTFKTRQQARGICAPSPC